MTQQFNLPPGMVEAAAKDLENWHKAGLSYPDCARSALQAALEWAVKEGWARYGAGYPSIPDKNRWAWQETWLIGPKDDPNFKNDFPALILRLEEPKP